MLVQLISGKWGLKALNIESGNGLVWWHQTITWSSINSLAPGRPGCHVKTAPFNLLLIGIFTSSKDNALRLMPRDLTDDKSTLVQVMAWCRQATSHYLSQCWHSSMSPYGITRPQWVNFKSTISSEKMIISKSKWFFPGTSELTHCGPVTPYDVRDLSQHVLRLD